MEITISATAVAWYGALVGTLSLVTSSYVALRDRARIKIVARPGFRVLGTGTGYDPNKKYICITVANTGRRTVTIDSVALLQRGKNSTSFLLSDSVREGAREILEGKPTTYLVDQEDLKLDAISGVVAYDQAGRSWKGKLTRDKEVAAKI